MPARPPARCRWFLAVPAVMLIACQTDRVVDAPDADPSARGNVPSVHIVYPEGEGGLCHHETALRCDRIEVVWEDVGAEVAGYQVKLIAAPLCLDLEQTTQYLTSPLFCPDPPAWNLVIPDSLIVADTVPVTDSTFHACDWYPKEETPLTSTSFMFEDVPVEAYLAVRAVDADGNVTPPEAFAFATADEGNVLPVSLHPEVYRWRIVLEERNTDRRWSGYDGGPGFAAVIPAGYPYDFAWEAVRYPCGPFPAVETAYAIDIADSSCFSCTDPDGIGEWSPWQPASGSVPFPVVYDASAGGETHTLHVRTRDVSAGDEGEIVRLALTVTSGGFQRPALWVDDFIVSGFNDCLHDAIVRPWLDAAVQPYIRAQEGIAALDVHAPGLSPCSENTQVTRPALEHLLRFRMLFWNVSGQGAGSGLGALTQNPTVEHPHEDDLATYVRSGGGLVLWGRNSIGHLLGDFFPQDTPYEPDLPAFPNPDFGSGSFLWSVMHLRTTFDTVGRGTSPALSLACSGIVGLEATPTAIAEGYPVGVVDPTGYSTDPSNTTVTPRTAIWLDGWQGRQNPFGYVASAPTGNPPLHEAGLDTLYTFASNSWSYLEDGPDAVADVCGTSELSPFEGQPIVMRYDDPSQGRVVWIGAPLYPFAEAHGDDIRLIFEKLIAWVLEEDRQ